MPTTFWSQIRTPLLPSSFLACASLLLACGTVDPADNRGQGGSGGSASKGGTDSGGEPGSAGAGATGAGGDGALLPLLPLATGNTWTYRVTKSGETSIKTTTVGELEEVGGAGPYADVLAYHIVTLKKDGTDRTESWQLPDEGNPLRILRYQEQSFKASTGDLDQTEYWDPPKLRIDGTAERTVAGASWLEAYSETKLKVGLTPTTHDVRDVWTVLADDATLEVPAGTFENVVHVRKSGGSNSKEYWFARGIGKLKETGSQTEELTEYDLVEEP